VVRNVHLSAQWNDNGISSATTNPIIDTLHDGKMAIQKRTSFFIVDVFYVSNYYILRKKTTELRKLIADKIIFNSPLDQ